MLRTARDRAVRARLAGALSLFAALAAGWAAGAPGAAPQLAPADARSDRAILLQAASFRTDGPLGRDAAARLFPAALRHGAPVEGGWAIVQFTADSRDAERRAVLQRHGAIAGPYLPRHARLARLPAGASPGLRAEPLVVWIGRLHPGLRLAPELTSAGAADDGALLLQLVTAPGLRGAALAEALRAAGAQPIGETDRGALAAIDDAATLVALARIEDVLWIERWEPPALLNDSSRGIVQSGEIGNDAVHLHGIRGAGQIVALMDSGLDTDHCCFDAPDKVVDYRAWGGGKLGALCGGDHGTHVTGTAACSNGGDHDGLAPDAQVIMQDIQADGFAACAFGSVSPPANLTSAWDDARQRGAFVHSNSWGGGGNSYGGSAASIDDYMWSHQDFLIVFAAGNGGSRSGSLGSYSNAKNSVTVGGSKNGAGFEDMYGSSSRGPAGDGRMLPDLLAPAQGVSSARNAASPSCGWTTYSGTSMATPAVAGAAALVREYFVDGWYPGGSPDAAAGFAPSAALVKATLLVSTRNMTGTGTRGDRPNADQGWGRVTLDDALWFAGEGPERRFVVLDDRNTATGFVAAGQLDSFELRPTALGELRVMLAWTDAPGAAGTSHALVNDLDLEVTTADGTTWLGSQGFEGGSSSVPGGSPDDLNNKEGVFLDAPAPGPVTVRVRARTIGDVALHPQDYALVAVGALDPLCGEAPAEGVGPAMQVSRDGPDVVLDWGARAAAGYRVYRGGSPDFLRSAPAPHDPDATDAEPGRPGIQWHDSGAADDGASWYYVAVSVNGCGEIAP
ncbi:MAG: hypothetical protein Kow0062_12530 [Acidobacteriota bacterium]